MRISTLPAGSEARSAGFTLLELLIVLAILGMTLAAAVPVFDRAMPGIELNAAARAIAATLREARGLAIASNREVAVAIDLDGRKIEIEQTGRNESISGRVGITLYVAGEELINKGAGRIRFYPDGTSTGGRVRVFLDDRKHDILVNWITGSVDIPE